MAKAVAVNARADAAVKPLLRPVTLLRIALIVGILALWQAIAESGLLYRDVVPSLLAIGGALIDTLADPAFYFHLYTTAYEIALAMLFGGGSGLIVGLLLGGSPLLSKALRSLSLLSRALPQDHLLPADDPVVRHRPGSKTAMGAISCFFPIALNAAGGMREIDAVLIRVGKSFRANTWQMVTKIYLPAMRYPVVNGIRLGLGVALIGTLLAETKLSNRGMGFLVIQAYDFFRMPEMYALLIILFVIAIGANALIGRLGGIANVKRG